MDTHSGSCVTTRIDALILAGGGSRRMGRDKTLLELKGEALIASVKKILSQLEIDIYISANECAKFLFLDCPVILDDPPGAGPLSALAGFLLRHHPGHVLLVGADMPFLNERVLKLLCDRAMDHDAIVLSDANGKIHPLPGLYSENLLPVTERILHEGRRNLMELVKRAPAKVLCWEDWRDLDPHGSTVVNLNTPVDLEKIRNPV